MIVLGFIKIEGKRVQLRMTRITKMLLSVIYLPRDCLDFETQMDWIHCYSTLYTKNLTIWMEISHLLLLQLFRVSRKCKRELFHFRLLDRDAR